MILTAGQVQRIAPVNPDRVYFLVQNLNTTSSNYVYLLQSEEEAETFRKTGVAVGGLGILEMQNCINFQSKKSWYALTDANNVDIRVMDV